MKQIFISSILIVLFGISNAHNLEIKLHLPEAANKKATLIHYYNSQFLADDTLTLDDSGKGTFCKGYCFASEDYTNFSCQENKTSTSF